MTMLLEVRVVPVRLWRWWLDMDTFGISLYLSADGGKMMLINGD